jgi:hypothetical protein
MTVFTERMDAHVAADKSVALSRQVSAELLIAGTGAEDHSV